METQKETKPVKHESNAHALAVEKTSIELGLSKFYVRQGLNGKVKSVTAQAIKRVFNEKLEAINKI